MVRRGLRGGAGFVSGVACGAGACRAVRQQNVGDNGTRPESHDLLLRRMLA